MSLMYLSMYFSVVAFNVSVNEITVTNHTVRDAFIHSRFKMKHEKLRFFTAVVSVIEKDSLFSILYLKRSRCPTTVADM